MAAKKSSPKKSSMKSSTKGSARTSPKKAGKPTEPSVARMRAASTNADSPSQDDLELRDRLKAGPRRPAGPPLVGDILTRAAMDALRDQEMPKPTDPKTIRARK